MSFIKKLLKDLKNLPLYLKRLNSKSFLLFLKRPFLIRRAIVQLDANFRTKDGKLIMSLGKANDISFHVTSISNIEAMMEIFYENIYKINTLDKCIVIDIGMNIGIASLYFALMPNVSKVYSFEPFKETYEQAVYNINLNREISKKIISENFGLSNKNELAEALFCSDFSGSMSTSKNNTLKLNINKNKLSSEKVTLRSASEVLSEILTENNEKVILKVDCEGSEYEIFEILDKDGILNKIDYLLLEWHFKGEKPILDILQKYGFVSFSRLIYYDLGLIYAVKKYYEK